MIKKTQTNFNWRHQDAYISAIANDDGAFKILFEEMTRAHLEALCNNWHVEAQTVSQDPAISGANLWTAADVNTLQAEVAKLGQLECRMCFLRGHEASYCPFNAQMNRVCASSPEAHALWKRWRIARSQYVKNLAAKEAIVAASQASKSRADSTAAVSSAAASAFGQ